MRFFSFAVYKTFAALFSILPFPLLYVISDFVCFVLFRIVGYRKKVVLANLQNSFPEKSAEEINVICKKFYRNLSDIAVETVKLSSMSKRELEKRCAFKNLHIIENYYDKGKSVIATVGHCGNWEWGALSLSIHSKHKVIGAYAPLSNPYFNNYFKRTREKFGIIMVPMKETVPFVLNYDKGLCLVGLIADQAPNVHSTNNYRTIFLNQDSLVFTGAERLAMKTDNPVVYFKINRIKRGFYEVDIIDLFPNPSSTKEYEITDKYIRTLEQQIIETPDNWIWSHRRWKHKLNGEK